MSGTMPKFLTAYGERKKIFTPTGDKIEKEYDYDINEKGQKVLVVVGQKNVYEAIQADLEESKIENVLARVAAGDNTVFRPDGIYTDLTDAPKNLIEARRMMQKLENTWNELPQSIKNNYNNDVEIFIAQSGTEKWLKDMGFAENIAEKVSEIQKTEDQATKEKGVSDES